MGKTLIFNSDDLKIVQEDLEYLADKWNSELSDPDIRRGSVILRRLLIENEINHAWRFIGESREPKVWCNIYTKPSQFEIHEIDFGSLGHLKIRGLEFNGLIMSRKVSDPTLGPAFKLEKREVSLTAFLDEFAIISQGKTITRRELIKYFAYVKGGVHLSSRRETAMSAVIKKADYIENSPILIAGRKVLPLEFLAIGQALVNSKDIDKIKHFRAL